MIKETFAVSRTTPKRSLGDVFTSLAEEVGELATEVSIQNGYSTKPEGKDGVIGESIDVIACALDMIWVFNPDITEEEVMTILKTKLEKWRNSRL